MLKSSYQFGILALIVTLLVPTGTFAESATAPVPRLDKKWPSGAKWVDRHKTRLEAVAEEDFDLIMIGDSITHQVERSKYVNGFLKEELNVEKVLNLGYGGDRTQHVLWRLQNGEIEGENPRAVVVMIGTNNVASNEPEEVAKAVGLICETLKEKLPETKVLLLAIFPRGETADDKWRVKNKEVNRVIAGLDDGMRIFFLNINEVFLDEKGDVSAEIMPDFLHPNDKGRALWMEAMKPKLQELLR